MKKKRKRRRKSGIARLLEYGAACIIVFVFIVRAAPMRAVRGLGNLLGDLLYFLGKRRREIAEENLRHAFNGEKNPQEIRDIARKSCRSFFLSFLEIIKLNHMLARPADRRGRAESAMQRMAAVFEKARRIQQEAGECIFVTPHIGNWEVLPHVFSAAGIPLTIVARPLDNPYLEKLIYSNRIASGQVIIPKRNALFHLGRTLRQGRSIGMLPDQSTMKGLLIDFFGRKATTTPVPAMLALKYTKPIVVVACCRKGEDYRYDVIVSDPIWPGTYTDKKTGILSITEEMTRRMEAIIRKYPEQYLWMHNRWKTYRGKKEFLS
ncbi:MAG: lysophospholipid acyltransferase family protein [Deferribacteres bacterium]|nr:lysophospholipid acyltransferase family protein [Deferribacteres bacterium]